MCACWSANVCACLHVHVCLGAHEYSNCTCECVLVHMCIFNSYTCMLLIDKVHFCYCKHVICLSIFNLTTLNYKHYFTMLDTIYRIHWQTTFFLNVHCGAYKIISCTYCMNITCNVQHVSLSAQLHPTNVWLLDVERTEQFPYITVTVMLAYSLNVRSGFLVKCHVKQNCVYYNQE